MRDSSLQLIWAMSLRAQLQALSSFILRKNLPHGSHEGAKTHSMILLYHIFKLISEVEGKLLLAR